MSATTVIPAGQDEPQDAVPSDHAEEQPEPAEKVPPARGIKARLDELRTDDSSVRTHLQRAAANTRSWLATANVTDGELVQQILEQRDRTHQTRATELRRQLARISEEIVAAKRTETAHGERNDPLRDGPAVVALKGRRELVETQLREHQNWVAELAAVPSDSEVGRARWGRKLGRAIALVGSVVGGGVLAPLHDPRLLLVSLPAAAVALWRAGLPIGETTPAGPEVALAQPGLTEADAPVVEGPGFAAAITAARQAAAEAGTPGSIAAREVAAAAEQAAQIQGAADLVAALIRAGIVAKGEEEETRLVGVIRPDGPGWTATVELPAGKTAEAAIGKAAELASALKVKTGQIQLSKDHSEDGHEGRLVMWVASTANPYAGRPVPSELIGADGWDFWKQGIPLGTNARGVRKILSMLWSSLLIGGLMGYGKSYLARLVAAAAVLDPYVDIVLLSGKSGADWAALKLVATHYVTGNSTAVIREMHTVMEEVIAEMAEHGVVLERLFETDPANCPEGKLTPELARRSDLHMTLLVVDELQEILDAAAGMKLVPTDETAEVNEDGRKGPAGQNGKAVMVSLFARFMRVARFVGGMAVIITQRPDSNSVPTELREVAAKRASFRVKGQHSARMVLGDDAVAAGAAPHLLMDAHKGVAVLDEGAEDGHDTIKADVIDLDAFRVICERGRDLRLKAGTLTGQAVRRWEREREEIQRRQVVADAVAAMDHHKVDRARLVVLAEWMAELSPERWHDLTETTLGGRLRDAGAGTTVRIGAVDGLSKASGYTREQLAAALTASTA